MARPRSCPECKSIGAPEGGCIHPWHGGVAWDVPPPRGPEEPEEPDWAGKDFRVAPLGPLVPQRTTSWFCLQCPRRDSGRDPLPAGMMAQQHGLDKRHAVQLMVITTWLPGEKQ
jgi:hypothetical protein